MKSFVIFVFAILLGAFLSLVSAEKAIGQADPRSTLTPIPTEMPLPEHPETLLDIQTLLQEVDEFCELPCFWGIKPGYTSATEVFGFLEPGVDFSTRRHSEYFFSERRGQQPIFSVLVIITDAVASLTQIILSDPSEWLPDETFELPHLLSIMPPLPQAYLTISRGQQRVFLTVAYDEGVLAQYAFKLRIEGDVSSPTGNEPYLFCPFLDQNSVIKLRLSNSDAQSMLEDFAIGFQPGATVNHYWSVDRMTGMEIDEFVEQIIENPNKCVELLSDNELMELGYPF